MRTTLRSHGIDLLKGIVASLVAGYVLLKTGGSTPSVSVSAQGFALVFGGVSVAGLYLWYKTKPFERVYPAAQSPMETYGGDFVVDPASLSPDKRVWHVLGGQDKTGAVLFGPYDHLSPGTYLARFRIKSRVVDPEGQYWVDVMYVHADSPSEALKSSSHKDDTRGQYQYRVKRFTVTRQMKHDNFEWRVRVDRGIEVWVDEIRIEAR